MADDEDATLLAAWSSGDRAAGATLLKKHFNLLYRFFRNKTHGSIDDLVQQTMMACTRAVGRYRGDASFPTFLLGVARNELLVYLRKQARKQSPVQPLEHSVAALLQSPSRAAAASHERELVAMGMRCLPVDLQITLELYYWEEQSVNAVAEITEVAPGTVKSRLSRGRALLKKWLEEQQISSEDLRAASIAIVESPQS